jgi:hypothetical protein
LLILHFHTRKKALINYKLKGEIEMKKFLLFSGILVFIFGCSTSYLTHPNASSIDQVQSSEAKALLQQLDNMDSDLALEVGRLPEFQENIREPQILALTRFINVMANASVAEKANLAKLLQIGYPKVRKYSAPLQAIFWVMEKKVDENILRYSLVELLDKAWDFSDSRWEDFETVTDRLNTPRLINYYQRKRFIFIPYPEHPVDSRWLFKTNKGTCVEFTSFSLICLKKAGYKAAGYSPPGKSDGFPGFHQVTLFKGKNGTLYVMDNGRICKKGVLKLSEYLGRNS